MAWPPAIKTFTVTFGPGTTLALGTDLGMKVDFTPSTSAVWAATGTPLIAMVESATADEGQEGSATLPNPDQDGFIDGAGNTVKNWTYRAAVSYTLAGRVVATASKVFTVTAADTTVDLDTLIPVTGSSGVVVAIPDTWSATVAEAQAAADEVNVGRLSPEQLYDTIGTQGVTQFARVEGGYKPIKLPVAKPMITTFPNGHGWSASGTGAGSNLNDTTVFSSGTQSAKVVTDGAGTAAFIDKTGLTIDLTGKVLRIKFRIGSEGDYAKLSQFVVYAGDGDLTNTFSWIAMQTEDSPGFQYTLGGEWCYITLSFADASTAGAPNRAAITHLRLRVKDTAAGPLTVWFDEVSAVAERTPTLFPGGVVSLVFDDCDASVVTQVFPTLSALGIPATIAAIRDVVDTAGYLTLDQLHTAEREYGWEVITHSDTLADHTAGFTNLTADQLRTDLRAVKQWTVENGFRGAQHNAYPKGYYNAETIPLIKEVYASGRGTVRRTRFETLPPADPYRIRTFEVYNTDTAANINGLIDKAIAENAWLILTFHIIRTPATAQTMYLPADFATVANYLASSGVAVRTYGDVLAAL